MTDREYYADTGIFQFIDDYADNFENRVTKAAYDDYVQFCLKNHYTPVSHIAFSRYITRFTNYKVVNKTVLSSKYRIFKLNWNTI